MQNELILQISGSTYKNQGKQRNFSEHSGSEKTASSKTRERKGEGYSCPDQYGSNPYLYTPLNTLLIWYQYLLHPIDYIMFYAVTRIPQMHFLQLKSSVFVIVNRPQWHRNPINPQLTRPPLLMQSKHYGFFTRLCLLCSSSVEYFIPNANKSVPTKMNISAQLIVQKEKRWASC